VDPGSITVHVAIVGKPSYDKTLSAAAGATIVFDVAHPDGEAAPPPPKQETTVRRHSRVVAAYAIGGIGSATLLRGVLIGYGAGRRYNDAIKNCTNVNGQNFCDPIPFNNAHNAGKLADIGTIVGSVGAAAMVVGAIVFFTAPRDTVVSPMANDSTLGLAIS